MIQKTADREHGRLESQGLDARLFTDQRWGEVRKPNKKAINLANIS